MSALTHFSLFSGIGGFPDGSFEKALAAGTKIPGHYHSDKGGIF